MYLKKLLVAALLLTCTAGFGQKVTLALEKGKKYDFISVTKVNTVASVMGQEMESIINNESTELIELKDVRKNEIDITTTLKSLKTDMNSMGQEMSYNSADKNSTGPMADELSKKVDVPKNYTIDKDGNTIRSDSSAKEEDATNLAMMGMTKETGLAFINRSIIGKDLKAGNSWPDTILSNGDKMKTVITGTYSVKTIENGTAQMVFNGNQNITGTLEQMGMEMAITGNNKIVSDISIDMATGLILSYRSNVTLAMNIDAGGMSIPTTGTSSMTYTLKAQ